MERKTDRQTNIQTDKQTNKQTYNQTDQVKSQSRDLLKCIIDVLSLFWVQEVCKLLS